tara:strand:- start:103 stop:255 length:153 start_codon:yes stop_codon:yes gene_type:complete
MTLEEEINKQLKAIGELVESMKEVKNETVLEALRGCLDLHLERLKELRNK